MSTQSFRYGDKTYKYAVHFLESSKKSISIHVLPDATVEVKAPAHTQPQKIVETMKKRARWVARHVDRTQQRLAQVLPREYVSGETHFYLGRRYVLKIVPSDVEQVKLIRGRFVVECRCSSKERVREILEAWYKEHAHEVFKRRFVSVAANIQWVQKTPLLTVREMKKQWGSCSPKGRISFNWNLVKAPIDCIDYVITHEICHLLEHNHSRKFYALMDKYYPDWRPVKAKLDAMAELLLNE